MTLRHAARPPVPSEPEAFGARLFELETECTRVRRQLDRLRGLQEASLELIAGGGADAVVERLLRAVHRSLGFSRAIYFGLQHGRAEARLQVDGCEPCEPSRERLDPSFGPALQRLVQGSEPWRVGTAAELLAPLIDVRGWYVACVLRGSEKPFGLLYVDGHDSCAQPDDSEIELVKSLAAVAAVAIENGSLLERMRTLAMRDPLTGLLNRRALEERLRQQIELVRRSGTSFAYVMLDVDDFKRINDVVGHDFGDEVLIRIATGLNQSCRAEDVVARFAGDEFVLLLVNVDPALAQQMVRRLSNDLAASGLRCSLGAALFPQCGPDARALLRAADGALYAAKRAGKGRFAFA